MKNLEFKSFARASGCPGKIFSNLISVLVVEDDHALLQTCSALLEEHGYNVIQCSNAMDAMDRIRKDRVDIVLTDIRLPKISGIKLLEDINSLKIGAPVIVMTGHAELDVAMDAMNKGAFDFIVKPFTTPILIRSLEMALMHRFKDFHS